MTESNNTGKNTRYGKIVNSAFFAFLIPFIGGAMLSFGASISESNRDVGIASMFIASGLFIYAIYKSAKDSIESEKRINKLEDRIKELENR
jgi:hypothetical protein